MATNQIAWKVAGHDAAVSAGASEADMMSMVVERSGRQMKRGSLQQKGFTLMELMIVVSIIAILAAIAYPAYTSQVQKSRRVDAKAALMTAAQTLERCFTENNSYAAAACVTAVPASWTVSQGDYTIAFTNRTATAYTLTATATGLQAGDSRCAVFTLTNVGAKTATNSDCW